MPKMFESDPLIVPMRFDQKEYSNDKKLRVGFYTSDGFMPASPACQRAVLEAVAKLRDAGHTVIEWNPPDVFEAVLLYYKLLSCDGAKTIWSVIKGELLEDYIKPLIGYPLKFPPWIKNVLGFILGRILGFKKAAKLIPALGERTIAQVSTLINIICLCFLSVRI